MRQEQVSTLFLLYTGLSEVQHYTPLIESAIREVEQMLRPTADVGDARLEYLAAAMCNLRFQMLEAPKDRLATTLTGTAVRQPDSTQKLRAAKELVAQYRILCKDLLRDDAFAFLFC